MRFIKKLVILTGGYSKGTLMLEKNSFGVWGRLSLFDYSLRESDRLVVLSGEDMFVMRLSSAMLNTTFELGEMELSSVHAAVVGEDVALYGSNCAQKLRPSVILDRVKSEERRLKDNEQKFIKFSGRDCEYFKEIAPSPYNDFALADKNYFPAYLNAVDDNDAEESESTLLISEEENKMEEEKQAKPMPHVLEQRYLHLMEVAASIMDSSKRKSEDNGNETIVNITDEVPPAPPKDEIHIFSGDGEEADIGKIKPASTPPVEQIELSEEVKKARTIRDYKEDRPAKGRKATYFERSSEQLNKLLSNNERFAPIERLIPGSKFVKINYDGQRYYLVGVIGVDYICYGVPAMFSETPPVPLNGYARWLPLDASNPHGDGFWMMYQDGVSGETLKS